MTPDWSKFTIRCSSLSVLFTEPKLKAGKEAGELSATAKKHLYKVYIQAVWGRAKDITTKQMTKGHLVEDEIIALVGFMDDKVYSKNTERKDNGWVQGCADIVSDIIEDVKASWDPETFIPNLLEPLSDNYFYQGQGYCWLWDKPMFRVSHALVNCPDLILKNEHRKLLFNMDVATDLSPEYLEAVGELNKNLLFDDIPKEQRLIRREVARDEEVIKQIPEKVIKARKFLAYLHKVHMNGREPIAPPIDVQSIPLIKIKK